MEEEEEMLVTLLILRHTKDAFSLSCDVTFERIWWSGSGRTFRVELFLFLDGIM